MPESNTDRSVGGAGEPRRVTGAGAGIGNGNPRRVTGAGTGIGSGNPRRVTGAGADIGNGNPKRGGGIGNSNGGFGGIPLNTEAIDGTAGIGTATFVNSSRVFL